MSLNKILGIFSVGLSLAMCVNNARAEQGEGTVRDPLTGKYIDHVYRDWQEGVVLNPETGDYTVTYKGSQGFFAEVIFVPATKIDSTLKSKFKDSRDSNGIRYSYKVKNGVGSKQNIDQLITLVSNVTPGSLEAPQRWEAHAIPQPPSQGPNLILSWTYFGGEYLSGLAPGKSLAGLSLESSDLPGIALVKISGAAPTTEWLGHYPVGVVGDQMEEIEKNNHIPRFAAVPKIPVGQPFDPALTLTGLQKHVNQDLVSMKLVDPVFASQLDRGLQAAIDAAKINNTKALKDHLKDLRHVLKREHGDVDKEDDEDDDGDGDKVKKPGLIDKLAARVLDFDIKYVEKRISGKN